MRVLVLGGRGFIGRHAVAALRERGHHPLVASRDPHLGREAHLERLTCARDWDALLDGFDAVVNAVGILRNRGHETYERVHHLAPAALAEACAARGVRLVHLSALGLHDAARSRFITTKLAGERAIARSGADYCIVRPSLLDGEGGFGARWLRAIARSPVHLVPRTATGRIAALDVQDLGEAIALLCESANGKEVELGGEAAWTLAGYLQVLRGARGLCPALQLEVPAWLARIVSHICDAAHFSPFSFGHFELLHRDNVPNVLFANRLAELLGRAPRRIGESCPGCLSSSSASGSPAPHSPRSILRSSPSCAKAVTSST
jgi:NADH dehydrogenase